MDRCLISASTPPIRPRAILTALETFQFNVAPHPYLGSPTLNVGTVRSGLNVNSVPDLAEIGIDIRSIPGLDHSRMQEHLKGRIGPRHFAGADCRCRCRLDRSIFAHGSTTYMQIARDVTGEDPGSEPKTAPYFTDASALTPAFGNPPTIIMGPGEAAKAHQTDEFCSVQRIRDASDIYSRVAAKWIERPE